jgi:hypothetical protein
MLSSVAGVRCGDIRWTSLASTKYMKCGLKFDDSGICSDIRVLVGSEYTQNLISCEHC